MKLVRIGSRQNMLQLKEGTETSWYKINDSNTKCLEAVKSLSVNDELEIQYTTINQIKVISEFKLASNVSQETEEKETLPIEEKKTLKAEGLIQNNFSEPKKPQEFKCADCGKRLDDGKYKTCYTCSMAARAKASKFNKSPEVQDIIKRQALGHMTANTMIALRGTTAINENNIEDTMEKIYLKYQQLVG